MLKLTGAFKNHPKREQERAFEPQSPLGVGDPPGYFDASQRECWAEIAEKGKDWLALADSLKVEVAAKMLAKERRNELDTAAGKRFDKLLSDLGFDPVTRSKVKAPPKPEEQNPYEALA